MKAVYQSLLLLLATSTDRALARQVQFLKVENQILRSKLPRIVLITPNERRRLLIYGSKLGGALKELLTIVSLRTFYRWKSQFKRPKSLVGSKPGRPRTPVEIRKLILKMARGNGWGYTRVLGELRKLGVFHLCNTVKNILRENGLEPGPQRGAGTWDDFLTRHAKTLWATDFFTKRVWTLKGRVELYVLFFIHIGSRRVTITGITAHPDRVWMAQRANFVVATAQAADPPTLLLRDYDGKFTKEFDAILAAEGVEVRKVGPCKPNLNAFAERWVQSVKQECLDHFVVFGEAHLRHILTEYVDHYNVERPHQSLGNKPLSGKEPMDATEPIRARDIVVAQRLGGLLKSYKRKAAA